MKLVAFTAAALLACWSLPASAQAPFEVSADVALSSLISLTDAHLRTVADTLGALAATPGVQRADWDAVKDPLRQVAALNVPAILTFSRPDGTYWALNGGRQSANIADRDYFKRAMHGDVVVGELVTSRSTGKPVAIIAVPIRSANGSVVGVLGAAVFLDALSAQIKKEMGVGRDYIFWAIDGTGKIALHSDPSNIFVEPGRMSPELARVRDEMLANDSGTTAYVFRGTHRTVVYRKSALTGWRYGFGIVSPAP
jgi:hypothetical protein